LDNPEAAKKLVQQITAKTRLLKQFPLLGRTLNVETNSQHRGYFVHPCVIVYQISLSGDIFVLHCYRQEQAISLADD
jgi:plasmid stabilization system protein ParE